MLLYSVNHLYTIQYSIIIIIFYQAALCIINTVLRHKYLKYLHQTNAVANCPSHHQMKLTSCVLAILSIELTELHILFIVPLAFSASRDSLLAGRIVRNNAGLISKAFTTFAMHHLTELIW